MKKTFCAVLALCLSFLLTFAALPAAAAGGAYPESPHPYENGKTDARRYTCPDAGRGVFVTFSADTWVQPYEAQWIVVPADHGALTLGDLISAWKRTGDYISVLDADRNAVGSFSGDELAGRTVYVPTASFEILLNADDTVNGYGYRVTDVRPAGKNEVRMISYRDGKSGLAETELAPRDGGGTFRENCEFGGELLTRDGFAFAGWSTVPGGDVVYDPGADVPAGIGDMELWAVWTPLALRSDEVLSFSNSSWYFEGGDRENYYLSAEDYRAMQLNLYKTYGLGPVPGPVLSAVLATYPDWEWQGSCYGMSTVVALQHFGYIDLLAGREETSLSALSADDDLISRVNYYQAQAATSWLTENKAYAVGAPDYTANLRRLYDAAAAGKLVLFTFYPDRAFLDTGHTVLFTGAYTRADGSRVLVAYDCNDGWTYRDAEYASRFVISPDFTSVTDDWGDAVGAFNWTADFDQFAPFDADGAGESPLVWYKALLRHILELFETLKRILRSR